MHSDPRPTPHESLSAFDERVIVAGTRDWNNYRFFCEVMDDYHAQFTGKTVVYISGKAASGADAMVIAWCKERGYPWAEFPADWKNLEAPGALIKHRNGPKGLERYNVRAGFARNAQMAGVGNRLITFHDGVSSGTADMTKNMLGKVGRDRVLTIIVDMEGEQNPRGKLQRTLINGISVIRGVEEEPEPAA